jgi:hypothetical protein
MGKDMENGVFTQKYPDICLKGLSKEKGCLSGGRSQGLDFKWARLR